MDEVNEEPIAENGVITEEPGSNPTEMKDNRLVCKERVIDKKNIAGCEIQSVIVYLEKAEVCRLVPITLNPDQSLEIIFTNLSSSIDRDSIRIEARGAPIIIQDVSFRNSASETGGSSSPGAIDAELTSLAESRRQNLRMRDSMIARQRRLTKQRAVLERFADALVRSQDGSSADLGDAGITEEPSKSGKRDPESGTLPKSGFTEVFDPRHMETLNGFFDMYEKQAEKLDEQILSSREELQQIDASITAVDRKSCDLEEEREKMVGRELSVYLESREVTVRTEIAICYVVNDCGWRPSYDIRIVNSEAKMKITYYALIRQQTGEDWREVQDLFVSTVQPASGGSVPDIGVQKVFFRSTNETKSQLALRHPTKAQRHQRMSKALSFQEKNTSSTNDNSAQSSSLSRTMPAAVNQTGQPGSPSANIMLRLVAGPVPRDTGFYSDDNTAAMSSHHSEEPGARSKSSTLDRQEMVNQVAKDIVQPASGGGSVTPGNVGSRLGPRSPCLSIGSSTRTDTPSAHYRVPRPPTLIESTTTAAAIHNPADWVKVVIGYLDLSPNFEYSCVPKRATFAYLRANCVNSSQFVVLPGDANVFIDSNYIGKSELGTVCLGEQFTCHIGADHKLQVAYHPMYKYRESAAPIGRTMCLTFKQMIEITNGHPRSVRVTLVDQMPLANEDKIKVNLQEPIVKHPEKYDKSKPIRISKSNLVEWDLDIASGEKKELTLKYTVEYPAGEILDLITE